jgi:hypothetical protein
MSSSRITPPKFCPPVNINSTEKVIIAKLTLFEKNPPPGMEVDFLIRANREKSTSFQKEIMESKYIKLYAIQDTNILWLDCRYASLATGGVLTKKN